MVAIALVVFAALFIVTAPYGRHERTGWGPLVSSRTGWLLMEAPASLLMLLPFLLVPLNPVVVLLLLAWQVHYFHRAFVYPMTLQSSRRMPVTVVVMAILFNTVNATLNGYHFVLHADWYSNAWLQRPNFIAGAVFFATGFYITKRSDRILRELRTEPGDNYKVPHGFLFRWISCPNYFGESIQWFGWALMTLSPAGWVFFIWTIANLLPRAISHHRWYRDTFENYPNERKAFLPSLL